MIKNLVIITFVSLISLVTNKTYGQNEFDYEWYVNGDLREGKLFYNINNHSAVYVDLISTEKNVKKRSNEGLTLAPGESATIINAKSYWDDRLFFKKDNQIKFTTDLLKKRFFVEDTTLQLQWNLKEDTKEINGYHCKKATVNLRGRDWEVWYTPDIPMYYGPWKFYGLPGLIVAAYESSGKFWFQLTKMTTNSDMIFPEISSKDFKHVSLKEYDLLEQEVFSGRAFFDLGASEDKDYKRNGIELIYEWEVEVKN